MRVEKQSQADLRLLKSESEASPEVPANHFLDVTAVEPEGHLPHGTAAEVRNIGAVPGMRPDMGHTPFGHGHEMVEVPREDLLPRVLPDAAYGVEVGVGEGPEERTLEYELLPGLRAGVVRSEREHRGEELAVRAASEPCVSRSEPIDIGKACPNADKTVPYWQNERVPESQGFP